MIANKQNCVTRTHPLLWAERFGVSLIEILVVIAILGLLFGLTVSAVQRVRDAAARSACQSNLRQLAMAVHMYAESKATLPKGCDYPFLASPHQLVQQCGISWQTSILPFLEQGPTWQATWNAHRDDPSGNSAAHDAISERWFPVLMCPSDGRRTGGREGIPRWGLTSYRGVAGTREVAQDGCFHQNYSVRFANITDGTSNTLLIGERPPGPQGVYGSWYASWGTSLCSSAQLLAVGRDAWLPSDTRNCPPATTVYREGLIENICDVNHFWSPHSCGANFAFADGSVRFLSYSVDPMMPALATRAGGEVVSLD
jgi:prepilin-type N-terminal cleavage/methylation domain-containing protein/prepilin-type processing-associated H-X9-DG protein